MFGQRENERKMRERWGCEDLFKKKKQEQQWIFIWSVPEQRNACCLQASWTMNNEKQKKTVHNEKRKADWSHTWNKKKNGEMGFPLLLRHPPLWNALSFLFPPDPKKSRTCSPLPSFFSFFFFFCSCLLQQASRCLLPSAALLCPSPSPISRLKKNKKTKKQRNSPLLRSLREGLQWRLFFYLILNRTLILNNIKY